MVNIILIAFFTTLLFSQNEIEGRWHLVGYEDNIMYQFEDGFRHSIYSVDGTFGDIENAGGTPNPYTVIDDIITIDLFFGNIVSYQMDYRCDGQVVDFIYIPNGAIHSTLFREGYNFIDNQCEEILEECFDFTGIDFGACTMVLGIGLLHDECSYISGCNWMIDDIDYSGLFFESIEECEYNCYLDSECNLTSEDILGPYYFEDAPFRDAIAHEDEPGQRLFVSGTVKQSNCQESISGSLIEVWQANDEGCYSIVEDCNSGNPENDYFNLRGKLFSDVNGSYAFESILPGYYGIRPRHIHIKITTPNGQELISQLYFENDPLCENDPWCQNADDRIVTLEEDEFGLHGAIDLIINSSESGAMLGDVNLDTLFNVQDIVLLIQIILDGVVLNDFQLYAADTNNDNNIDILDIVQLVNLILEPNNQLPDECYIIPLVGPCEGLCPTYYFNQETNQCEEFMTGCCGVEAFSTLQECQNTCN